MSAILSKNCVLAGEVECYCLVCCELLPAEHDVLAHIQLASHEHNLSSHAYLHKFQRDCIRKVAGVYFCEFCNLTFPTAAKVSLHVTEQSHLENKKGRMFTRGDNCIVFNENIKITENAWNGLVDDTCVLCNAEFEDESVHKHEQNHILNLIKSRVIIGANNDIYREVDGIYHCLTCNKVLSANILTEHLNSATHKSLLTKFDRSQNDFSDEKRKEEHPKDKIADKKDAEDKSNVSKKSLDNDTKTSKEVQSNGVDGKSLYTRPVQMKKAQKPASLTSVPKDVESLAKKHGMSIKNGNKIYCDKCCAEVAATQHSIKEHVAGKKHTDKLTKLSDIKNETAIKLKKVNLKDHIFCTEFVEIQPKLPRGNNEAIPHVIFNEKYFLNVFKFLGFARFHDKIICQFCRVHLTDQNKDIHINSAQHRELLEKCFFVTSVEDEFIRQLKPDLFDCVFCGHAENDWEDMLEHLDTDEHKRSRRLHETLLLDYKVSVIEHHVRNSVPFSLLAMMNNLRTF